METDLRSEMRKQEIEENQKEWEKQEWKRIRDGETPKSKQREEWMLSLPEGKTGIVGLAPRQFKKSGKVTTQDASWTSTPGKVDPEAVKKKQKTDLMEDIERKKESDREKAFQEASKHRGLSLLEIHKQKIEKEKQTKTSGPLDDYPRPFDRDRDLQTRIFDPKRTDELLKKSKEFNSNFMRGGFH